MDVQSPFAVIGRHPLRGLVIPEREGFHDDALLQDGLIERLPLVGRSPMHEDDQHGGVQRLLAVQGQFFQRLHLLGFLHDHQLPVCHHREAPGGGDHRLGIHISPVADSLVEVLLPFLQAVVDDGVAHEVRIIRLLPHQQVHRLEGAGLRLLDETADQPVRFHVRFCCHDLSGSDLTVKTPCLHPFPQA